MWLCFKHCNRIWDVSSSCRLVAAAGSERVLPFKVQVFQLVVAVLERQGLEGAVLDGFRLPLLCFMVNLCRALHVFSLAWSCPTSCSLG